MNDLIELGPKDFLTADTHIGGAPWPYKLWFKKANGDPIEQLRDTAARIWDEQVSLDSTIVIIGDALDLRAESVERELEWFSERVGRKVLIPGNNDLCHPMFADKKVEDAGWSEVFTIMPARTSMIKIGEHVVPACHYPNSERVQARWSHEKALDGLPVLHGHTHARKAASRTAEGVLQINVGWPAWKKLAAVPAILEELTVPWQL